jgi:hypothetical protein
MAKDGTQRVGDVARIQQPGRHLVEQRREEVVVVLVDQDNVDRLAVELAGAGEAAEPGADDDYRRCHVRPVTFLHSHCSGS